MYAMLSQCRVCALKDDSLVSELDKDLLGGMSINDVMYKYSGKFNDLPLTKTSLYHHRKHLRGSIPAATLQIPDLGSGANPPSELATGDRSKAFDTYVGSNQKERELVEIIVNSAMEDLLTTDKIMEGAMNVEDMALVMNVRNQIRRSVGEFIDLSQEMGDPTIGMNVGDTNKKLFVEFLLIVKRAAEVCIKDQKVFEEFLLEITTQLRKSKEFKTILQEEKDRRDIAQNVEKEAGG